MQLPPAVSAAGPAACAAWVQFVADERFRPSTLSIYRGRALQFLRWLEVQHLGLSQVTPAEVERFLHGLNVGSDHARMTYRTGLRRFFDALVAYGVIPGNPADQAGRGTDSLLATAPHDPVQPETDEQPPTLLEIDRRIGRISSSLCKLEGELQGLRFGRSLMVNKSDQQHSESD
jgi:hypothetical protein